MQSSPFEHDAEALCAPAREAHGDRAAEDPTGSQAQGPSYATLPEPGERWLEALDGLRGAYAEQTLEQSARSFRRFRDWCDRRKLSALPAASSTVAAFMDDHALLFAPRTMMLHLWGVRRVHIALGLPSPLDGESVRLARLRHLRRRPRRQRQDVTPDILERVLAASSAGLLGLRDRAMLHLAFDTFCRRGELVRLRVEELTALPDGSAHMAVRRVRDGAERICGVAFLSQRGSEAVEAWLDAAGLLSGPILRRLSRGQVQRRALSPAQVSQRLGVLAARARVDTTTRRGLTTHGFRVGAAQTLAASGRSLAQVTQAGRWRTLDIPAEYLREARVNLWGQPDGDTYPVYPGGHRWRKIPSRN